MRTVIERGEEPRIDIDVDAFRSARCKIDLAEARQPLGRFPSAARR
jgi:hypothetical protein